MLPKVIPGTSHRGHFGSAARSGIPVQLSGSAARSGDAAAPARQRGRVGGFALAALRGSAIWQGVGAAARRCGAPVVQPSGSAS